MKHIEEIQELIHGELDDYSFFEGWELHFDEDYEGAEYYTLSLKTPTKKDIKFKIEEETSGKTGTKMYVRLGDDSWWEEVTTYNFLVKHFWMAVLSWEI